MEKFLNKQKILGSLHLADTNTNSIVVPSLKRKALISHIFVSNLTASDATYRLYAGTNSASYTNTDSISYDVTISANTTTILQFDTPIGIENPGGLAARANTANAVTVVVFGSEFEGSSIGG